MGEYMECIIKVKDLKKVYKQGDVNVTAIEIEELNIKKGEITSILGKSGSGKSTLLHLLGGMDEPTRGEVVINGMSLYEKKSMTSRIRSRTVGFVFQEFNLIPELTVIENIRLPLDILNQAYDRAYEKIIVDMLELTDRLSFYPRQLSGGQKQRTAIARALITKPAVVLADEPTGSIDQLSSHNLMQYIKNSNKDFQQTYVIVTHDPEVASYSHNQIYIEDGKIRGTYEEIPEASN